jgi:hypothetical protein
MADEQIDGEPNPEEIAQEERKAAEVRELMRLHPRRPPVWALPTLPTTMVSVVA